MARPHRFLRVMPRSGGWRALCWCGWWSGPAATGLDARDAYTDHVVEARRQEADR